MSILQKVTMGDAERHKFILGQEAKSPEKVRSSNFLILRGQTMVDLDAPFFFRF